MNQQDLIVNKTPVIVNRDSDGVWVKDCVIILKPDITDNERLGIMSYLYEEGFILDRRTRYEVK